MSSKYSGNDLIKLSVVSRNHYKLDVPGKVKTYHANMLKREKPAKRQDHGNAQNSC